MFVFTLIFSTTSNPNYAEAISNGWYQIVSARAPYRVLDVQNVATHVGANIQIWSRGNVPQQKFKVTNIGNGYFTLTAGNCNLNVAAANDSRQLRTNVQLASPNPNDPKQQWRAVSTGQSGLFYIESRLQSKFALDCQDSGNADGTNIWLWEYGNVEWNKWRFESTSAPNGDTGSYDSKVKAFINDTRYRPGSKWNNCFNYASAFTNYVFGKSPRQGAYFKNANEIRNGDVVHVNAANGKSQHWIVVLYRNGNRLTTVEGNWTNQAVNYSDSAYTIQNGTLYRGNAPFRAWDCGYHFQ